MSHLSYFKSETRGIIRIEREDKHNALTIDDWQSLAEMVTRAGTDKDLRSLTITGSGTKTFCAGADLRGMGDEAAFRSAEMVTAAANAVADCPLPVLAALNGGCYGGAIELALTCDFRIGVKTMKAFVPAARIGLRYHPQGIKRYLDRLGSGMARRLLLAAEEFDGEQLLQAGFLDIMVNPGHLDGSVLAWCSRFAKLAPEAVSAMKQSLNTLESGTSADTMIPAWQDSFQSDELVEGLAAVAENRPAAFIR